MDVIACLAAMALLAGFTAWVIHRDGQGVGEERAYADMDRRRRAERRMHEAHDRVTSRNSTTTIGRK